MVRLPTIQYGFHYVLNMTMFSQSTKSDSSVLLFRILLGAVEMIILLVGNWVVMWVLHLPLKAFVLCPIVRDCQNQENPVL